MIELIKKIVAIVLLYLDFWWLLGFIIMFLELVAETLSARTPDRILLGSIFAALYLFLIAAAIVAGGELLKIILEE